MTKTTAVILSLALLVAVPAIGCMWDYDTLKDEKRGMPGVAEVLAGQWERHSAFFYRHRVEKMKAVLTTRPDDWDAMDNLAVAYEKLDDRDAAIGVMLDKDRRRPGQYTTYANLGTFYIHKGDPDRGIDNLQKGLKINPDAHFGREEYQVRLAKFLKSAATQPAVRDDDFLNLREARYGGEPVTRPDGSIYREDFFLSSLGPRGLEKLDVKPNVFDGIVGMIRFGTGQSADLYFALGDLLAARGDKNLAVRAYRRALDFHYPRPGVVNHAIDTVSELQVPKGGLNADVIAAEKAAADKWVSEYQQFEDDLIRAGKDTDDESNYAPFYAAHDRALSTPDVFSGDQVALHRNEISVTSILAALLVTIAGGVLVYLRHRRNRRRKPLSPAV